MIASRWAPALLLGAVLVSHLPLLRAGYVQDDHVAIEASHVVAEGAAGDILAASYWEGARGGDRSLYRPLTVASYAVERALTGHPSPAVSHTINLALHAIAAWLVYAIAVQCGLSLPAALLGALLFAVWPSSSEAVANVVGRAELLAAVFTLGAVRAGLAPASRTAAWSAGACVLLACSAKETGLVALPLLALAAIVSAAPSRRALDVFGMVLPACLAFVVFVVFRTAALEAFFPRQTVPLMDNPLVAEHGLRRLATALGLITRYARIVVFPWGLANDYSGASVPIEASLLAWRPLGGLAIGCGLAAIASRGRIVALFASIAVLPYLLIGNLVVPVGAILAERFLYLPVAGLCLLAAAAIHRFGAIAVRVAAPAVAVGAALMFARSGDWASDATIFAATARHNPRSPRAPYWLGSLAVDAGRPEAALPLLDTAIRNWPAFASPWHDRGLILARRGDAAGAERAFSEAIRLEPAWASPQINLALLLHRSGDRAGALRCARKAVLDDPDDAKAWAELGHLRFESGAFREAAQAYRRAVSLGRADLAPRLAEAEARD